MQARREAEAQGWRALDLEEAVQRAHPRALRRQCSGCKREAAERAAAEAQLRQVQKMEAVGQLTGGIAHDFNNMLAVVVGGLDLARRKLHGSRREVEFHLDNAMEGATRAAALTRRLLAFARAEPLLPEAVAPAELVENMLELVDRAIGERITVHTRFADDAWHVWADPTQLENAILNLARQRPRRDGRRAATSTIQVDNVTLARGRGRRPPRRRLCPHPRHATPAAASRPSISTACSSPSSPPSRSARAPASASRQIFGFARQSGGDVAIASALGQGTTVSLYLPRSAAAAEQAAGRRRAAQRAAPSRPRRAGRGAAILVVEDDPRVSRSTVAALEELGYRPHPCAERQGGARHARRASPRSISSSPT